MATNVEGLVEVVSSEELFEKGELEARDEFDKIAFEDKTIMRFKSLTDAANFGIGFVRDYLLPKYGPQGVEEFPMDRSEPLQTLTQQEASLKIGRAAGLLPEDPDKEIWLVVSTDRYNEVQKYIDLLESEA